MSSAKDGPFREQSSHRDRSRALSQLTARGDRLDNVVVALEEL